MTRFLGWRKTTMVFLLVGGLGLAAIIGAQRVHAFGRGGHGGHGGGGGGLGMLMQLDLTADQKARIREMLPAYRVEKEKLRDALHAWSVGIFFKSEGKRQERH